MQPARSFLPGRNDFDRRGRVASVDVEADDKLSAGADADGSVIVPDVVAPPVPRLEDQRGGAESPLGIVGPSGGAGETFEVLTDVDGSIVVRLMGLLDLSSVPELDAAVSRVLRSRGGRLVIDGSALEFADSSAIALLVRWSNQASEIELRDPSPTLRRMIVRMGLAERLRMTS
jgi:anti-anti-sigma factor